MPTIPRTLLAAAVSAALMSAAHAAPAAQEPETLADPVVVTATRTEKLLTDTAASVGVVTDAAIAEQQSLTVAEVLSDIPNVESTDYDMPIFSKLSIRGSDANEITYLIDGVRQDNYTLSGNRPNGLFLDPEIIKQVEVRRGGGSSLYGNGGIGGTVAVTTKSAADLLRPGENFGALVKTGYASDSREWSKTAYAYGRHGIFDAVVGYTRRDGGKVKSSRSGHRSSSDRDRYNIKDEL